MGDTERCCAGCKTRGTMGRRKIEMEYLTDDRVRKVTFCKRKGGLFKKADDLSKLCGVEVAVMIVAENKTQHFATSDLDRIVTRFQTLNSGQPLAEESETDRLWKKLETQRREIEALQRQLADERKKVEALVGGELQMLAVHPQPPPALSGPPALGTSLMPAMPSIMPVQAVQAPQAVQTVMPVPVLAVPQPSQSQDGVLVAPSAVDPPQLAMSAPLPTSMSVLEQPDAKRPRTSL